MKYLFGYIPLLFISVIGYSQSQLLGGNAFLQGKYIELGVNQCGGFGTTLAAPAGFHARSGASSQFGTASMLGFVADPDKDGWTVGVPNKYNGDYFLPLAPYVGWNISFNNLNFGTDRTYSTTSCNGYGSSTMSFPGGLTGVVTNNGVSAAIWEGVNSGLAVKKVFTLSQNKLYFTVNVTCKNVGISTIYDIYYGDYVNPDNGFFRNDIPTTNTSTTNTIVYQPVPDNKSLVQAISPNGNIYLGLGSKDCRSKVFRTIGNLSSVQPSPFSAVAFYNGSSVNLLTGADQILSNAAIGISFSLGMLAAGDSTSFLYTYILRAQDFNEALAATVPGFSINNIKYQSNDTVSVCANSVVPVKLTNAEDYTWNWTPATGVTPTTGIDVNIAIGNTPVQYIATGTGPCGIIKDTVNLIPYANRLYVDSSIVASGNGTSWATPLKTLTEALNIANDITCVEEIWVKKGTYFSMKNATIEATSRDSSFRINRGGVKLYGGFAGNETSIDQRNFANNQTILSGNIGLRNDSLDNAYHVVTIIYNALFKDTTTVDGFIIKDGIANNQNATYSINGRVVYCYQGGGIYADGVMLKLQNNLFTNNYAYREGGGVYLSNYISNFQTGSFASVEDCEFTHNSGFFGGGMCVNWAPVKINNSRFTDNIGVNGGALLVGINLGGSFINAEISNTILTGNECKKDPSFGNTPAGAALWVEQGTNLSIVNCLITGNKAAKSSAILFREYPSAVSKTTLTIINTTISGNYSYTPGDGTVTTYYTNSKIQNSIISGNSEGVFNINGTSPIIYNSLVQGLNTTSNGNLSGITNPQFINSLPALSAPTNGGDYNLKRCSPVINRGDNSFLPAGIINDLIGNQRVQNTVVDMGAYESNFQSHSVTIAATPAFPVCAATAVTFTATPLNAGALAPGYQWVKNGVALTGEISATYNSNTLLSGDIISVLLTPDFGCTIIPDTSNNITVLVNPKVTPLVSISTAQTNICEGSPVTFTAMPTNAGATPKYQWKINGINTGTNNPILTSTTLNNNDVVTVTLTSSAGCLTDNNIVSNSIIMQVSPRVSPVVTITTSANPVCSGKPATFTASAQHAGINPMYQWKINGVNAGISNKQFTYAAFTNNDMVTVTLTSSENCLLINDVGSNTIAVKVANDPVLSLSADNLEILQGGSTMLHVSSSEPIRTYVWSPAQYLSNASVSNPVASPMKETLFTLNATSEPGCKSSAAITIKVVKGPVISNTFSPNGDGINDLWIIKNLETYPGCRVQVFTRTGQLVFESRGYQQPWNGTFKGQSLTMDTYYYILELNNRIGSKPITGYVTIIK